MIDNNFNFSTNQTFLNDIELDICIKNERNEIAEIIEIKMFKTNRPIDTQVSNLRDAVSKIKIATENLTTINPNFKHLNKSLITNITDSQVYLQAKEELQEDIKNYNINLCTINDFYNRIKK